MKNELNRPPLAERLQQGLREGVAYARNETALKTTLVPVPRAFTGEEVAAIRAKWNMSQAQFASVLAVNVKTLQSWEQGYRKPSRPTMRLLQIFDSPEDFRRVLLPRE